MAVIELGGARRRSDDIIDHYVGFEKLRAVHDEVNKDVPLARVHARNEKTMQIAKRMVRNAYNISPKKRIKKNPAIIERLG